jgi:hypothetical protein
VIGVPALPPAENTRLLRYSYTGNTDKKSVNAPSSGAPAISGIRFSCLI